MAWERVKANRGAGGVDGQSIDDFAEVREEQLDGLHEDLRDDVYRPQPVRQKRIPKAGKPGAHRELGIPTVYDRVCQQALLNRLEPIFEPVFDDASFGYRRGRSQGWGHYYKRAHVRKLFHQLDGWVVRRVWAHRYKRWRCRGWKSLPSATLYGELGLVNLVGLIPSIGPHHARTSS